MHSLSSTTKGCHRPTLIPCDGCHGMHANGMHVTHVMSCHVMSCHVMSCHVMSCHVSCGSQSHIPCHVWGMRASPDRSLSMFAQPELNHKGLSQTHTHPMPWMPWDACEWDTRHVTACHVMSCHIMSCHVMSCPVMSAVVANPTSHVMFGG